MAKPADRNNDAYQTGQRLMLMYHARYLFIGDDNEQSTLALLLGAVASVGICSTSQVVEPFVIDFMTIRRLSSH